MDIQFQLYSSSAKLDDILPDFLVYQLQVDKIFWQVCNQFGKNGYFLNLLEFSKRLADFHSPQVWFVMLV